MRVCDQNMINLASKGDADREDSGCGILYGILLDSAYKIKKIAQAEKQAHINKGLWKDDLKMDSQEAAARIVKSMKENNFIVSEHIVRFIMAGKITVRMIRDAALSGKIIEVHKHPARGNSFLMTGFSGEKPVHLVCSFNNPDIMMLLFVYIPSLPVWKDHLTRNIKKRSCQVNQKLQERSQKCFFCGGELKRIRFASFDYRLEGELYVVNNVDAALCLQCGEKYISPDTAQKINDLIAAGGFSGTQKIHVVKL